MNAIRKMLLEIFGVTILAIIAGIPDLFAQGIGISETSITPDASAILELRYSSGTYKGFLLPRMTTANRNTIASGSPPVGLTLYNTTTNSLDLFTGSWVSLAPLSSPTFTGTVTIPSPFTLGVTSVTTTGTQLNYLNAAIGTTGTASTNLVFSTAPTLTGITLAAGTATVDPLTFTAGTNLTTPAAGAVEYDGVNSYITNETTSGRGAIPVEQHFLLTAAGGAITTIANFFGTNSNISLASGGIYEIEIECWFLKTTAGTVTWSFVNSVAPTSQDIYVKLSPAGGISAPPGAATYLEGNVYNNAAATYTFTTASLTTAVNHYAYFKILLINGTGTSLRIRVTSNTGSLTPGIGSRWYCKRLSPNNIGTFAP